MDRADRDYGRLSLQLIFGLIFGLFVELLSNSITDPTKEALGPWALPIALVTILGLVGLQRQRPIPEEWARVLA